MEPAAKNLTYFSRFILLRGVSGFYSYAIFEHLKGWPDLNIDEARIAFKLHQDMLDQLTHFNMLALMFICAV